MSTTQYVHISQPHLQFYCKQCVSMGERYNFLAALSRIAHCAPNVQSMRSQAESEFNLLRFYSVCLPDVQKVTDRQVSIHAPSTDMLHDFCPWMLEQFVPAQVVGDGNCLFRSISLSLYGTEDVHDHLRLLASIEVLLNPGVYDRTGDAYYQPYKEDDGVWVSDYDTL